MFVVPRWKENLATWKKKAKLEQEKHERDKLLFMKVRNSNVDKTLGGNYNLKPSGEFLLKSVTKLVNCEHNHKHQELGT